MTVLGTMRSKAVVVRTRARRVFVFGTVLASWLLAALPHALALDPDLRISQYGHTVWRIQDGAISPPTNTAQTTDGFLWVTTPQGLMRFDGLRLMPWQPPQGQNLPGTHFSAVFGSRDSSLWIGTTRGLARWKDGQLRTYTDLEHPAAIAAIIEDDSGTIWATRYGFECTQGTAVQYKLEGYDRDWQDAGTRRQAFYGNLPPRNYIFRVKACK